MSETEDTGRMAGSVKNLLLTDNSVEDRAIIKKINQLAELMPGIRTKDAFRNFLLRALPTEIDRLRKSGGQVA